MLPKEVAARQAVLKGLSGDGTAGQQRRHAFREAIKRTAHEFHSLGIEMNQRYTGPGIYVADEPHPDVATGRAAKDDVLYY